MRRRVTGSAACGICLLALTASGQPPAAATKPAEKKPADPLDALIAAALANDPDIRTARAKMQLALGELAKARLQVTLRVTVLQTSIQEQQLVVATAEAHYRHKRNLAESGILSRDSLDILSAKDKLGSAQAQLARLEAELKLLTAPGAGLVDPATGKPLTVDVSDSFRPNPAGAARPPAAPLGPIPARLRAALDKSVKLGDKDASVSFEAAVAAFKKDAGMDVPVRNTFKVNPVRSLGEELAVGAWLQMFADANLGLRFVVREYGILVANKDEAPPDAQTVGQFWQATAAPPAAGPELRVRLRLNGVPTEVDTSGPGRTRAAALAKAAVALYHAGEQLDGDNFNDRLAQAWDKRRAGDHLGVALPDRASFGLAPDSDWLPKEGQAVVLIGLKPDLSPDPVVFVRVGDKIDLARDFPPAAAKAFTEALLGAADGK